jgi:hypothetical protein
MILGFRLCFFRSHWIKVPWINDVVVLKFFDMSST